MPGKPAELAKYYDKHFLKLMKSSESDLLSELHEKHERLFREICSELVKRNGYDAKSLSPKLAEEIEEKAEELIDNWDEDELEGATGARVGLQALLMEHHEVEERIMDIRDTVLERGIRRGKY